LFGISHLSMLRISLRYAWLEAESRTAVLEYYWRSLSSLALRCLGQLRARSVGQCVNVQIMSTMWSLPFVMTKGGTFRGAFTCLASYSRANDRLVQLV
jgi:hypothetical protein